MADSAQLSVIAKEAIGNASIRYLSGASAYEVSYKVRLGKWPEIEGKIDRMCGHPALTHIPASFDTFDRMIAATAIELECPLIAKDDKFDALDGVCGWKCRVW